MRLHKRILVGTLAVLPLLFFVGTALHRSFDRDLIMEMDGNYTYVDNAKLLECIAGSWLSQDGRFHLFIQIDGSISIEFNGTIVLEDTLEFSYLQPGYVASTEFELSQWELKDQEGIYIGTICFLRHEASDEDLISMKIETIDGNYETIVFEKSERK